MCGTLTYEPSGVSKDFDESHSTITVTDNSSTGVMDMNVTPSSSEVIGIEIIEFKVTLVDPYATYDVEIYDQMTIYFLCPELPTLEITVPMTDTTILFDVATPDTVEYELEQI